MKLLKFIVRRLVDKIYCPGANKCREQQDKFCSQYEDENLYRKWGKKSCKGMKEERCLSMKNTGVTTSDSVFQDHPVTVFQLLPMAMKESLSSTLVYSVSSNGYAENKDFGFGSCSAKTNIFEEYCFGNSDFRMNGFTGHGNQIFIESKREKETLLPYYIYSGEKIVEKNADSDFRMNGFTGHGNRIFIESKREKTAFLPYYIYSDEKMFEKNADIDFRPNDFTGKGNQISVESKREKTASLPYYIYSGKKMLEKNADSDFRLNDFIGNANQISVESKKEKDVPLPYYIYSGKKIVEKNADADFRLNDFTGKGNQIFIESKKEKTAPLPYYMYSGKKIVEKNADADFRLNDFTGDGNQIFIEAKSEKETFLPYYIYSSKNMLEKNTDIYSNNFSVAKRGRLLDFMGECSTVNVVKSEIVETKTMSKGDSVSETKSFCTEKTRERFENLTKVEKWNVSDSSEKMKFLHDFGLTENEEDKFVFLPCSVFTGGIYNKEEISFTLKLDDPKESNRKNKDVEEYNRMQRTTLHIIKY
ncbi:MAG: hypothetical protein LBL13_00420 [Bacteroidales bacterium]|jgi:hypothetical protein|nr:hypothetical protein [Bacteroidales bacterium]